MVDNINYTSIREAIDRTLRHPMMKSVTLDQVIQYAVDFIRLIGIPDIYEDRKDTVDIEDFRGIIPYNIVCIKQVRLHDSKKPLYAMTSVSDESPSDLTYKTQGNVIYTSFRDGEIDVFYNTIKADEDGLPMIPDDPVFLTALDLYIKLQVFTILFDQGKIPATVLTNVEQHYSFAAGRCIGKFQTPSVSEMQAITNMMHRMIPDENAYETGFRNTGKKEIRNY